MLNLHCNKNDKKKHKKKIINYAITVIRTQDVWVQIPTEVSTTLWRAMKLTDKNNKYMLKF